ncbi:hypothetical protein FRACYDRAFT_250347 [Fragilariopsis cylindrus CCMP1102]|uniref:Uncharacterized protein n=1 Tax=Fragilariopsis cylindrus CCMP1102 TaxID=635003 RepID=A0A1E7ERF5_9STRA|nr:hypothetical protein FRACYDRAFT_250347 [Fragilariopsis cylindrus CCMP1102]|eukprot:OEU08123.1 hypothetical protein FRACYDRAFT_250347 [Fragilariopsis cylindrus CCMP1102]
MTSTRSTMSKHKNIVRNATSTGQSATNDRIDQQNGLLENADDESISCGYCPKRHYLIVSALISIDAPLLLFGSSKSEPGASPGSDSYFEFFKWSEINSRGGKLEGGQRKSNDYTSITVKTRTEDFEEVEVPTFHSLEILQRVPSGTDLTNTKGSREGQ